MSKQRRDVPRSTVPWHRKSRHRPQLRRGEVSSALRSGSPAQGKMLLSSEQGGGGGGARLGLRLTRIRQPLPSFCAQEHLQPADFWCCPVWCSLGSL